MNICLRRWMYLDHEGIASLDAQLRKTIVEQTRKISSSKGTSIQSTGGIGMYGVKADRTSGSATENGYEIFERTAYADEQILLDLEAHLASVEQLEHIRCVRSIAEIYVKGKSEFVTGVLPFRWARTHDIDPVIDAIKKEMVEFVLDKEACDDGGMLSVPVRMGGSLEKCVSRKKPERWACYSYKPLGMFPARSWYRCWPTAWIFRSSAAFAKIDLAKTLRDMVSIAVADASALYVAF